MSDVASLGWWSVVFCACLTFRRADAVKRGLWGRKWAERKRQARLQWIIILTILSKLILYIPKLSKINSERQRERYKTTNLLNYRIKLLHVGTQPAGYLSFFFSFRKQYTAPFWDFPDNLTWTAKNESFHPSFIRLHKLIPRAFQVRGGGAGARV